MTYMLHICEMCVEANKDTTVSYCKVKYNTFTPLSFCSFHIEHAIITLHTSYFLYWVCSLGVRDTDKIAGSGFFWNTLCSCLRYAASEFSEPSNISILMQSMCIVNQSSPNSHSVPYELRAFVFFLLFSPNAFLMWSYFNCFHTSQAPLWNS